MQKRSNSRVAFGKFTDFNVWESELSDTEMNDFTTCKSEMKGDLIDWNIDDWRFTDGIATDEYSVETVDYNSFCLNTNVRTVFFDDNCTLLVYIISPKTF